MVVYIIYNLWKSYGSKVKACVKTITVKLPCCRNCITNNDEDDEGFLQFTANTGRLEGSNHYRQPSVSSNDQENVQLLHRESTFTNSQHSGYGATQSTNLTDMTNISSDTALVSRGQTLFRTEGKGLGFSHRATCRPAPWSTKFKISV